MYIFSTILVGVIGTLTSITTLTQAATATDPASTTALVTSVAPEILETVLVSGEQPGPGMWKVSKGDHVLWIVGIQTPVPKKHDVAG